MKSATLCILWTSLLMVTTHAFGVLPELTAPLPRRPAENPLNVTSPVRVEWEDQIELVVEIRQDRHVIFPTRTGYASLASGCEFYLDPGVYQIILREPGAKSVPSASRQSTTWIRVLRQPIEFDLRAKAPGSRVELAELRYQLESTQGQISGIASAVDEICDRLKPIEDGLLILLEQFTIVDNSSGKPVVVQKPFQWLADRVNKVEAHHDKK